ncbi:hypothetical protein Tco_1274866 [Tanacetum coccineum]
MTTLKFADSHNMVAFLTKSAKSEGFEQIVDFLNANPIRYALTINPTIYASCIKQFWATVKMKTVNGEVQLQALVDGKKIIITEATVRRDLQLEDAEGIDCLPNANIFEQLTIIGAKTTAWNEFSSTMASVPQPSNPTNVADEAVNEEPSMQLKELMDFCTKLQQIVGRSARVVSSNEASLGDQEDASKQGRKIDDIDSNAGITLDSTHFDADTDMFGVHDLDGDEVVVESEVAAKKKDDEVNVVKEVVKLKSVKPKVTTATTATTKGILLQEPSESITTTTTTTIPSKDKGKGIMVEEPLKMKKKDQISFDEQEAIRLQAEFDKKVRLAREKDEANVALIEE